MFHLLKISLLWLKKNLSGLSFRLFSQFLRVLSICLRRHSAMSKSARPLLWSCSSGSLNLSLPEDQASFSIENDRFVCMHRGRLSLSEFLGFAFKFLSVYKKMVSL